MKIRDPRIVFGSLIILLIISFASAIATAQSNFEVESLNTIVYRDGLVHVREELITNELSPKIVLPLLSASIENLIVLDNNQLPVDYEISGSNLTIFTFGVTNILVEYDTLSLTRKEAEVWTLIADFPNNLQVLLPENSTIIYLSEMPSAIDTIGNSITLSLEAGYWEISYVTAFFPPDENNVPWNTIPLEYLVFALFAFAFIIFSAILVIRRRKRPNIQRILKANPQLKKEDRDVIVFLAENDGKAFEAEIRERFSDIPRTSLWRLVRRLERLEIVEVKRIGLENQVKLKR